MIISIRKIEKQLGSYNKEIQKSEKKMIKMVRRSGYLKRNMALNEKLKIKDINFFRPALTENFLHLYKIIGMKLRRKSRSNQILKLKDLY